MAFARGLLDDPRIGWISITDNPGGGPMLPPDWLAGQVGRPRRREVVVHLTCKDINRNGLEAAAWRYASEGFDNILALTGDYPTGGFRGLPEPVFDLDSVGLIALLRAMNEGPGSARPRRQARRRCRRPTSSSAAAVSPFKRHERELMPQYFKLLRKIRRRRPVGDSAVGLRHAEVPRGQAAAGLAGHADVPVIGNVYLLTRGVAKLFNSGKLAGCVVSDELLEQCEKYAAGPDKGKKFFRELAAKQLAVFKGLGFAAGYLGGIHKAGDLRPDHRPGRELRPRRLAGVHQGDSLLAAGRVLPLRARSADRAERRRRSINPRVSSPRWQRRRSRRKSRWATGFRGWCTAWPSRAARACTACCSGSFARWDKKPGV